MICTQEGSCGQLACRARRWAGLVDVRAHRCGCVCAQVLDPHRLRRDHLVEQRPGPAKQRRTDRSVPSILHLCRRLLTSLAASRTVLQLTLDPAGTSEPSEHEWNRSGSQQRRTRRRVRNGCRMVQNAEAAERVRGRPGDGRLSRRPGGSMRGGWRLQTRRTARGRPTPARRRRRPSTLIASSPQMG